MQGGAARFDPRLLFIFFCYLNIDYISRGGRGGSGEPWLRRWHKGDGFNPRVRCSSCQNDFERRTDQPAAVFLAWLVLLVQTKLLFWEVKGDI